MNNKQHLIILQANVGKGCVAHETILNLAFSNKADFVLVQEPRIKAAQKRKTVTHKSFQCFAPETDWVTHPPRVLTYMRKGQGLYCIQNSPFPTPTNDILVTRIGRKNISDITLFNIYNAPAGAINSGKAVDIITTNVHFTPEQRVLLLGDLNLKHPRWQPGTSLNHGAATFAEWTDEENLQLLSLPGLATHKAGNVLDLTWASPNLVGAQAAIDEALHSTSDHETIYITIPYPATSPTQAVGRYRFDTMDIRLFNTRLKANLPSLIQPQDSDGLDLFAQSIIEAFGIALKSSTKRVIGKGTATQYWTEEVRQSYREVTTLRKLITGLRSVGGDTRYEETDLQIRMKEFKDTFCKSKRDFWQKKISEARTGTQIFEMVGWHKLTGNYGTPPLKDPDTGDYAYSQQAKRNLLRSALLQNRAEAPDVPICTNNNHLPLLPFPDITDHEVEKAVLSVSNTAPGNDQITTDILKRAWPIVKPHILLLYKRAVAIGYHPKPFRTANIVIINKPGKKDTSSPRSYRPISLLSVLGKGLERLIAKRISWIAIKHKIVHKQQFGALPLRSCTDLITALVQEIEQALNSRKVATLLTLDIKGAFDAVLPGRLIQILKEQGWPITLVRWISSFATHREACISLDGEKGDFFSLECGLPQGSPVSPILFMLYIASLLKRKTSPVLTRYGYADDIALLAKGDSSSLNCTILADEWGRALQWGQDNGVTFDFGKSELIHFSRKRNEKHPALTVVKPDLTSYTVYAKSSKQSLRWLGVFFDSRFTFKLHVEKWAAKASSIAEGVRSLGNTVRGPPVKLMIQAMRACALASLYYGAEAWWPSERRMVEGKEISNRVQELVNKINKVQNKIIRAALPIYKTTPTAILQREAGFPPAQIVLDAKLHMQAARLHKLDPYHPLKHRAKRLIPNTRLARLVSLAAEGEHLNPLELPPWEIRLSWNDALAKVGYSLDVDKERAAISFKARLGTVSIADIVVFSDGSQLTKEGKRLAGAGWCAYQGNREILSGSLPLGGNQEVYDAEAYGALYGLKAASESSSTAYASRIIICLDNVSVACRLIRPESGSSEHVFKDYYKAVQDWGQRARKPWVRDQGVEVWWCPGHTNIPGNERADQLAKEAAKAIPAFPICSSYANIRRKGKEFSLKQHQLFWAKNIPDSYSNLRIRIAKSPPELLLPRKALGKLYAARSGHGDFANYHRRLKHTNYIGACSCGKPKTQIHPLLCLKAKGISKAFDNFKKSGVQTMIDRVLGTAEGAQAWAKWLDDTNYFEEISL